MYTGRVIQSNIDWILLKVRKIRYGSNLLGNSSILFRSIVWTTDGTSPPDHSGLNILRYSFDLIKKNYNDDDKNSDSIDDEKCKDFQKSFNSKPDGDREDNRLLTSSSRNNNEDNNTTTRYLAKADSLFYEEHYEEARDLLVKYPDQNLAEVKWRLARTLFSLSHSKTDKLERNELINEAFRLIESALKVCEESFIIQKWMSIILDAKAELKGVISRIESFKKIQEHMIRAVQLNSKDPSTWFILGVLEFGLAELPWFQKTFISAATSMSSKGYNGSGLSQKPKGSYEKALQYFHHAENLRPGFYIKNNLMLGKCYAALKRPKDAKSYLLKVINNYHTRCKEDIICKNEAKQLLNKLITA